MFIFIKNGEADMGIELFPHNQTAYESALSLLKEYGKAAVIHPTGTGKSMIAFKLAEEYPASRICWLAPSAYIFKTQLENLKREGGDALLNIVFLTYAALMKMEKDGISELSPDCIVLDEFHRCGAVEWGKGVARLLSVFPSAKILGLSATAVRFLDNQRDMAAELFDGHVASELTLGEAVVSGILPTPVYVLSFYSFQKELDAWGGRVAAAVSQKQKAQGERILQKLRRAIEQADGLDVVFKRHMKERAGKYLLFCADRGHMEEMMRHVREWFWRVDKEPHVYSVYFGNPASLKEFEAFKADKSDHLKLLFCIDLLNEGVHVEDVSGVILLRPTASPTLYLQQIGRSLSSGKSGQPVIFDIVNNFDSLCCIDFLKEEMRSALAMRGQEDAQEMFPHRFSIIDETGDCRKLFMQLKENLKADFEAYYRVAEEYHREYGDLNVPKNYSSKNGLSLGSWLASLRRARAGKIRGSLTKEQILRLDTLGMVWELPSEANWERGIKALEEYFREHGDANVKAAYAAKDGFRLGRWVSNLRQKAGKEGGLDFLTEEQKNRLLAVGMVWDVNAYRWEQNYEAARQYFLEHGNLEVPAKYCARDGKKLGVWIQNQKQAYAGKKGAAGLTAEQVKKLMELGLEFKKQGTAADIRPNERNQKTDGWEERYRIAADYYRRTGSLAVPQNCVSGGVWIGKWLCEQRKRYRRQDGAAPLSDIQASRSRFARTGSAVAMGHRQKSVRILVALHKPYRMPEGEMYLPIQVGKSLSKLDLRIQGDNSGEHISEKNRNYCELTALYWAWKNLDADYIGLAHYRRHFCLNRKKDKWSSVLDASDVARVLKEAPVILPKKRNYLIETNESQYLHAHHREGWEAMYRIIASDYPECLPALNRMRESRKGHRFNMCIMRQDYFRAYCAWLFDILFKVEKSIDISGYSVSEARVFGYLGERMLDVWIDANQIPYREAGVVFMEKQNWLKKGLNFLKRKFT